MDALTQLAIAAGRGDRNALTALVRTTQRDVWRFCAHLVDRQSADDLTQETYLRAVRQLKQFRGDGTFLSWLLTIARRCCAKEVAARQRRRDVSLDLAVPQDADAGDYPLQVELALLLSSLEPERRAAIVLTQVLGYSYNQTAEICECPIGTIQSRVARARNELIALSARNHRAVGEERLPGHA